MDTATLAIVIISFLALGIATGWALGFGQAERGREEAIAEAVEAAVDDALEATPAPLTAQATTEEAVVILTEANRRQLMEEIGAIVQSTLPPLLKDAAQPEKHDPVGVGSLDEWYAGRSIIQPTPVLGERVDRGK